MAHNSLKKVRSLFLPKGLFTKKDDGNSFNLTDYLEEVLIQWGIKTHKECCDCDCGYDTSGVDFSSPVTVQDWVVDGDTITIDLSADNWSQVADILSNLGFGKFSVMISNGVVSGGICAPTNSHVFGDLTIDDGSEYGATLILECPVIIVD